MDERKFLKTAARVREILIREPYAREDDIYLTWLYWREIDPDIDNLKMSEFKTLFLSGYFGLPASITRARALIQNKTNPELKGIFSEKKRSDRANTWRSWFASEGRNRSKPLTADLEIVSSALEADLVLEKLKEIRQAGIKPLISEEDHKLAEQREETIKQGLKYKVITETIDEMKKDKNLLLRGEKWYTLGEFMAEFKPGLTIDFGTAERIRQAGNRMNRERGITPRLKPGTGIRDGIPVPTYRYTILDLAIKEILNPEIKKK
jgi:hypothetical protein